MWEARSEEKYDLRKKDFYVRDRSLVNAIRR